MNCVRHRSRAALGDKRHGGTAVPWGHLNAGQGGFMFLINIVLEVSGKERKLNNWYKYWGKGQIQCWCERMRKISLQE